MFRWDSVYQKLLKTYSFLTELFLKIQGIIAFWNTVQIK